LIYQTGYAGDILIFKEAIRRVCEALDALGEKIKFTDRGTEPENDIRISV